MTNTELVPLPIKITSAPVATYHKVDLDAAIGEAEDYRLFLDVLRTSSTSDVIHIYISSPGGYLATTNAILSAMAQTQAHVITEIVGDCQSAATLVFLAGDEFRVNPGVSFMIHTASFGSGGKANNVKQQVDFMHQHTAKLVNYHYKHFLLEDEITLILDGSDLWLSADEVKDRLVSRRAALEAEAQAEEAEAQAVEAEAEAKARRAALTAGALESTEDALTYPL